MKRVAFIALVASAALLTACNEKPEEASKTVVGVLDESNLNDIMMTVADPDEAVNYFQNASAKDPARADLQRGFASSLTRAKRSSEASVAYKKLIAMPEATDQDRVDYAAALIRVNDWAGAKEQLNFVPPTYETFQRYRLEAMVADSEKKWSKADSFYETAVGLTTQPANVLNNWGYSKLTRGKNRAAEELFIEAISFEPSLYHAKNNLVLSRAGRGEYKLPPIPMSEIERAELTYTAGLSAFKQGKKSLAKGLVEEAIDLHPQHFTEAVRTLKSM